jgi:hypothetical protein
MQRFAKKGARAMCEQPACKAIIDWAFSKHGLRAGRIDLL